MSVRYPNLGAMPGCMRTLADAQRAWEAFYAKPVRGPRKDGEHAEQVVFFNRIRALAMSDRRFELAVSQTFAIPNGGGRSKREAGRLKAEGVKAGVSDLMCALPSGSFHGLFIEMKSLTGYASREQREWIARCQRIGYHGAVCRGADVAFAEWKAYVEGSFE